MWVLNVNEYSPISLILIFCFGDMTFCDILEYLRERLGLMWFLFMSLQPHGRPSPYFLKFKVYWVQ